MLADNPRGDAIIHTNIACGILGTAAVLMRFLARWKSKANFAADDWCILASLIPSYGMMVSSSFMVARGGAGRHAKTLTHDETRIFLQTYDACLETYSITTVMVKISILLLYRRLFITPAFRKATIGLGVVCVCWGLAATIGILLHCHPVADMWVLADTVNPHKCIPIKTFMTAVLVPNLVLDFVVLGMPLYIVWNLKLQRSEKAIITGLFMLGGLSCIASMIRLINLRIVVSKDFSYTFVKTYIWSQIEPTTAIVCACLTTCRPLVASVKLGSLKSLSWTSRSSTRFNTKDDSYMLTESTRHRGSLRWLDSKRSSHVARGKDCDKKMKGPTVAVEEIPPTPPVEMRNGRVDEFDIGFASAQNRGEVEYTVV